MNKLASIVTMLVCGGLAACGGDDAPAEEPDADTTPAAVTNVDCAGAAIAQEFTTSGFNFSPATATISAGEIARFTPEGAHDVNGEGFDVSLGGDECFRFDDPGTYTFICNPHGFQGTLTVQ